MALQTRASALREKQHSVSLERRHGLECVRPRATHVPADQPSDEGDASLTCKVPLSH